MQEPFDIIADLDTPVSAYLKLAELRPRYLLESVERGMLLARYSFLGFGNASEVLLDRSGLYVDGVHRAAPANGAEFLEVLRAALAAAPRPLPAIPELPFTGGLVGFSGYGVAGQFERLPESCVESCENPECAYVATESVLVFDHLTRRVALLHAGSAGERSDLRQRVIKLLRGPVPSTPAGGEVGRPRASLDQPAFEQRVTRGKEYIAAGDLYQIVVSVRFDGESHVEPFEVYRALRLLNPSPYMFYCEIGGLKIAGSSPEALVRLNGRQAQLRPIAGTLPRGETDAEDDSNEQRLLADPKEIAEHVMLVDLARNDLGRVAGVGSVRVDPYMTVERYSHVMHIVSGVRGLLASGKDAFDLFAAVFPAGTLVGAPKIRAMEIINELEPVHRGLYAGTVGYFGNGGDMDQAITIRSIVFDGDRYSYQAGAGIVADSDPAREYKEVLAKSAILRRALEMAKDGL